MFSIPIERNSFNEYFEWLRSRADVESPGQRALRTELTYLFAALHIPYSGNPNLPDREQSASARRKARQFQFAPILAKVQPKVFRFVDRDLGVGRQGSENLGQSRVSHLRRSADHRSSEMFQV
jgi:hypothetical protein